MTIAKLTAALIAGAVSSVAFANGTAPAAAPTAVPGTPEAWVAKMTDPTQNASAFKDPKAFVPWMIAVTDPATAMAMSNAMMNPRPEVNRGAGEKTPATMDNDMEFLVAAVSMKWMGAAMDPNFYTAAMSPFMNPNVYMKWMMAPMDPRAMQMGMQMMNPGLYTNWMMAPMSPQAMNAMMAPMNPALYSNWMNTAVNPATYGTMGAFVNPATYSNATQGFNPFVFMVPMTGAVPAPAAPAAQQ